MQDTHNILMSAKESDHMQATHIQAYDGGNAKEMQKEKKEM